MWWRKRGSRTATGTARAAGPAAALARAAPAFNPCFAASASMRAAVHCISSRARCSLVFIDIIVLSRAVSPAVVGSGGVRCEHRQEGVGGEEDERGGGRRKYQEVCYVMIII